MGIWAAVKYALNSTLGTSSFLPLDKMIQAHGTQTFTADGTFTVPTGVKIIWITAAAGGQAGTNGSSTSSAGYHSYSGDGGGGGDCILKKAFNVTPGQKISITVGTGGKSSGAVGSATVIGSLVTLAGGDNARSTANNGGGTGGVGHSRYRESSGYSIVHYASPGQNGLLGSGGAVANNYNGSGGGGGGGGSIGNGGNGAKDSSILAQAGIMGGGGGGGYMTSDDYRYGAAGGDGIVIIEW